MVIMVLHFLSLLWVTVMEVPGGMESEASSEVETSLQLMPPS